MTDEKKDLIKMSLISLMVFIIDIVVIAGLIIMITHSMPAILIGLAVIIPALILSVFHYGCIQFWKDFFKKRKEMKLE